MNRTGRYRSIARVLETLDYHNLQKRDKSAVKRMLEDRVGFSRAQLTRLIRQHRETGRIVDHRSRAERVLDGRKDDARRPRPQQPEEGGPIKWLLLPFVLLLATCTEGTPVAPDAPEIAGVWSVDSYGHRWQLGLRPGARIASVQGDFVWETPAGKTFAGGSVSGTYRYPRVRLAFGTCSFRGTMEARGVEMTGSMSCQEGGRARRDRKDFALTLAKQTRIRFGR